jgi:2-keto-4-pentenoate hydratase
VDPETRAKAADELLNAYSTREPVDPLIQTYPDIELADAYQIQLLQIQTLLGRGGVIKGHKVGLTSRAMQKQLGVNEPDYGHLLADMFYLEHLPIPTDRFLQPRIEPEIAFVLKKPLKGPGVTTAEAINAVDYVLPALEIVDSRVRDWKISLIDTISDNASSGAVVLGSSPTPLAGIDLRLAGCTFHRNSQVVGTGAGGAILGSPLNALVWLANTVGALGVTLEAGHVVLPGAVTSLVPVEPGDSFTATFAGLGSVTARFARGQQ